MNKARRKDIDAAVAVLQQASADLQTMRDLIDDAKSSLETAKDDEQEFKDNMPENLQSSEKGEAADAAVSCLEDAVVEIDAADEAMDNLLSDIDGLIGQLESAMSAAGDATH